MKYRLSCRADLEFEKRDENEDSLFEDVFERGNRSETPELLKKYGT